MLLGQFKVPAAEPQRVSTYFANINILCYNEKIIK